MVAKSTAETKKDSILDVFRAELALKMRHSFCSLLIDQPGGPMRKFRYLCLLFVCHSVFSLSVFADFLSIQNGNKFQCGGWGCSKLYVDPQGRFYLEFNGRTYFSPVNVANAILAQPDYQGNVLQPHKMRAREFYKSLPSLTSPASADGARSSMAKSGTAKNKDHVVVAPSQTSSVARPTTDEAPATCSGKREEVTLEGKLLGSVPSSIPGRVAYRFQTWNGEIIADTRVDSNRVSRLNSMVGHRVILDRGYYFERRLSDGSCARTVNIGEIYSQEDLGPSGKYSEVAGPGFESLPRPNLALSHYCSLRCAPFSIEPKYCRALGIPGLSGVVGTGKNGCQALKDLCTKARNLEDDSQSLGRSSYSCIDQS